VVTMASRGGDMVTMALRGGDVVTMASQGGDVVTKASQGGDVVMKASRWKCGDDGFAEWCESGGARRWLGRSNDVAQGKGSQSTANTKTETL
jgi:hypothetical protein